MPSMKPCHILLVLRRTVKDDRLLQSFDGPAGMCDQVMTHSFDPVDYGLQGDVWHVPSCVRCEGIKVG